MIGRQTVILVIKKHTKRVLGKIRRFRFRIVLNVFVIINDYLRNVDPLQSRLDIFFI